MGDLGIWTQEDFWLSDKKSLFKISLFTCLKVRTQHLGVGEQAETVKTTMDQILIVSIIAENNTGF